MSNTIQSAGSSTTAASGASAAATTTDTTNLATKDMFLKLLVAQIKNQDPLNPADGVQFLTQLAQFTSLEQTISMSTDIKAIRQDLDAAATASGADAASQT